MFGRRRSVLGWMVGLVLAGCCVQPVSKLVKQESAIVWQEASPRAGELNGRHYYLLEEGFTCTAGMVPGKAVPSWREHVSISNGQLLDWGTLCNDTQMLVGPVDVAMKVSPDLVWLHYQGKVYRHFATPPLPRKGGESHE